jgi:hypothetical protein
MGLSLKNYIMKKLNLVLIENSLLLLLTILLFLAVKSVIPKYFIFIGIISLSIYFFPIKLLTNKTKEFSKLYIVSDIIISISLVLLIVGFYLENKLIISLFGFLNFIFLVFFAFQYATNSENNKLIYRKIIINHLLIVFLLQMIKYF